MIDNFLIRRFIAFMIGHLALALCIVRNAFFLTCPVERKIYCMTQTIFLYFCQKVGGQPTKKLPLVITYFLIDYANLVKLFFSAQNYNPYAANTFDFYSFVVEVF